MTQVNHEINGRFDFGNINYNQNNTQVGCTDIVVYGIALNTTEKDLYDEMRGRGLNVVWCTLLTTYEHARTLTFKLTITSSDNEKSKNMAVWPPGVTVKPYRERKPSRLNVYKPKNERRIINPNNNGNQQISIDNNWLRQQQPNYQ